MVLVVVSALFTTTGTVRWIYLIGALALGTGFITRAVRLANGEGTEGAEALYLLSLVYPALLFGAVIADSLVNRYAIG